MKRSLLLTTAVCGFCALVGAPDVQAAGTITTTTTTVWTQDFPNGEPRSEPRIDKSEKTEEDCQDSCAYLVTQNYGVSGLGGNLVELIENGTISLNYNTVKKLQDDGQLYLSAKEKAKLNSALIDKVKYMEIGQSSKDPKTGCMYIKGSSCFAYNTLVSMADGSVKKIGEIVEGDETAYGIVHQTFIRRFDQSRTMESDFQEAYNGGLYNYRGILVTGNHAVRDGARWMRVADTQDAVPVGAGEAAPVGTVYNLDVEGGIIPIVNPDGELIAFLDDKQPFVLQRLTA